MRRVNVEPVDDRRRSGGPMRRLAVTFAAAAVAFAVWSPPSTGVAAPPPLVHHAALGPLAQSALSAIAQGRQLPKAWLQGRPTKPRHDVRSFPPRHHDRRCDRRDRGGAGNCANVGATAQATLIELSALSALPGVTEVELAGQADVATGSSVPAIPGWEPGARRARQVSPDLCRYGRLGSIRMSRAKAARSSQQGVGPSASSGWGESPCLPTAPCMHGIHRWRSDARPATAKRRWFHV